MRITIITKGFVLIAIILCFIFFLIINHNSNKVELNITVFEINNGWGYKIKKKNKTIIYQPNIPVIEGNEPFHSKNDALKAAEMVRCKIIHRKIPALTKNELINAGISLNRNSY